MEPDLAVALAILRLIRGWTQEELAVLSGVRASSLSDYERGRRVSELRTLQTLLAAMEFPLAAVDEAQRCVALLRRLQGEHGKAAGDSGHALEPAELSVAAVAPCEIEQVAEQTAQAAGQLVRLLLRRQAVGEPVETSHGDGS